MRSIAGSSRVAPAGDCKTRRSTRSGWASAKAVANRPPIELLTSDTFCTPLASHNPHRISQFVPRRGQTFASCWETFRAHEADRVKLWGYNIAGLRSAAYRDLLTD